MTSLKYVIKEKKGIFMLKKDRMAQKRQGGPKKSAGRAALLNLLSLIPNVGITLYL